MKPNVRKCVLAYSGGLDTSVILTWLIENYHCEVICFTADLGQEDELDGLVEGWTSTRTAEEVMKTLQAAGVATGVVQNARDTLENDPHLEARGYYAYLDHPEAGRTAYDGPGFRLSKTPGKLQSPAPMLGEHTDYVCRAVLGMDDEEIAQLVMAGVLF